MPSRKSNSEAIGQSLGQLLIVGFEGTELTPPAATMLKQLQPAGVILFARNIASAGQTWRLLRDCQKCVATPLFTCVDMEGGLVDRFRNLLGPTPSAADVFATAGRKLFRRHGQIIGEHCRALGFNVDFAPALDLAFEASRSVMSSRAVSADPREAVSYAREFIAGLKSASVLPCGKHFPGLGEGNLDSHHELPVIEKPLKKIWAEDIAPYRALHKQLPFVMVSHAAYPQVTHDRTPASLSKQWITTILRKRIGFRNLIVSDDLEMGGVLAAATIGQAAVGHIRAGGDLCLVCHRADYVAQVHEELIRAVEQDKKFAERVQESVSRVLKFKKKSEKVLRPAKMPTDSQVKKMSEALRKFADQVRTQTQRDSRSRA